eukprot:1312931-Amphidinium_carterae.1
MQENLKNSLKSEKNNTQKGRHDNRVARFASLPHTRSQPRGQTGEFSNGRCSSWFCSCCRALTSFERTTPRNPTPSPKSARE